jgi:hypothetical protein
MPDHPAFVLQLLDEHDEPRRPAVFRSGANIVTPHLTAATTYPDRIAAIEAAPGPGWRVVEKAQVEREIKVVGA